MFFILLTMSKEVVFSAVQCAVIKTQSRTLVNHKSENGRQLLLISCHCYREFCISNGSFPILESLYLALGKSSSLYLIRFHLTLSDCQAVGLVLQHYNSVIVAIYFWSCDLSDICYSQLADGLEMCRNLQLLPLARNNLTDQHASHIAMVIRNNTATLPNLGTCIVLLIIWHTHAVYCSQKEHTMFLLSNSPCPCQGLISCIFYPKNSLTL